MKSPVSLAGGLCQDDQGNCQLGLVTVPQKHMNGRVFRYTLAKVIGGGSTINAQIYFRGNKLDYNEWAQLGCTGCLQRRPPLFQALRKNQNGPNEFHGASGPLGVSNPVSPLPICEAFFKAAGELGIPHNKDFNGGRAERRRPLPTHPVECPPFLRGHQLSPRGPEPGNLTIRKNVFVKRIVVDNGRATAVELADEIIHASREIILSSGTVGSPKLLMHSGIGPADHLKSVGIKPVHDLPGVGPTCRTISTSSSSANAPATIPMTNIPNPIGRHWRQSSILRCGTVPSPHPSLKPAAFGMPMKMPAPPISSSIGAGIRN